MRLDELKGWLDSQDEWDYQLDDKGIIIRNERFQTLTHATYEAVEANTLEAITASCSQGRDVDHITRVTGYFSRTSGWNKGKAGELKDRHRVRVK
jgi:anaerobic ribonucleoside-triphosphate reductase